MKWRPIYYLIVLPLLIAVGVAAYNGIKDPKNFLLYASLPLLVLLATVLVLLKFRGRE